MTGGLGPDACIDAVGMEAHGASIDYYYYYYYYYCYYYYYDKLKTMTYLATDRAVTLRQAINNCRKGGIVLRLPIWTWCESILMSHRHRSISFRLQMAKRRKADTTVPPITGSFEDAVRALLKTPPPPKNLGRPKAQKRKKGATKL